MKRILIPILFGCLFFCNAACSEEDHTVPTYSNDEEQEEQEELTPESSYDWETSREDILESTDMVLLYGGGHHRTPYTWSTERAIDYVYYTDTNNKGHWLFDSFLFLEIYDQGTGGANKMFANGYGLESANKEDWSNLIDYYFQSETGIGALNECVRQTIAKLGTPQQKRQVVISIPEPIVYQNPSQTGSSTQYWGEIDDETLDFSKSADRIKACQWFIDQVRAKFNKMQYQYIDLAGFYWLAEKATDTRTILNSIAGYLNNLKYSFNWIPYYGADGYSQWSSFGFNYAYLQPNYFFNDNTPDSRLDTACQLAISYNMNMEMEFDDNALTSRGKAYKLRNYMEKFKEYGIWDEKKLAYYQGSSSLRSLKNSTTTADQELYHEFCQFVINRPIRSSN